MPCVSIMIPAFNRAHLIDSTIESALHQSEQNIEVIVVDDASTDATVEVVQRYAARDARLRLVVNERNLGLTRNWNRCLNLAASPFVQLLLSDDLIDANYVDLVLRAFVENPGVGFVASACRHIGPDGALLDSPQPRPSRRFERGDDAIAGLLQHGFPHVSSIVMRKACVEACGGFDERIWHGPDVELDVRIAARYGYYYFGDAHTSFRRHGGNMGALEYLRADFLEADMFKKRLAWSYLSSEGLQRLRVDDLDAFLARDGAQTALSGAAIVLGYGRPRLSASYLRQALRLDGAVARQLRFWKIFALLALPVLGPHLAARRLRIGHRDRVEAMKVEESLSRLRSAAGAQREEDARHTSRP